MLIRIGAQKATGSPRNPRWSPKRCPCPQPEPREPQESVRPHPRVLLAGRPGLLCSCGHLVCLSKRAAAGRLHARGHCRPLPANIRCAWKIFPMNPGQAPARATTTYGVFQTLLSTCQHHKGGDPSPHATRVPAPSFRSVLSV